MSTCESKRFLRATDVVLLSQLPVVSLVTSVRFVISHVNRAGLDKAALDCSVYSGFVQPTVNYYYFMITNLDRGVDKKKNLDEAKHREIIFSNQQKSGFCSDVGSYSTDHLIVVILRCE